MNNKGCAISGKLNENATVEDFIKCSHNCIALSDGAGGYGIMADLWAEYMVENVPNTPLRSYEQLSQWTDKIWQPFFDMAKTKIADNNPFVQNKFYEEGSCATLAVMWLINDNHFEWCTYGDSALFVYNTMTHKMTIMSIETPDTYDKNPNLINWKECPNPKGWKSGQKKLTQYEIAFIASDALSCYLTMVYMTLNGQPLNLSEHSRLNTHANSIREQGYKNFYHDILEPLIKATSDNSSFRKWLEPKLANKEIATDDYSFGWLKPTSKQISLSTIKNKTQYKKIHTC